MYLIVNKQIGSFRKKKKENIPKVVKVQRKQLQVLKHVLCEANNIRRETLDFGLQSLSTN